MLPSLSARPPACLLAWQFAIGRMAAGRSVHYPTFRKVGHETRRRLASFDPTNLRRHPKIAMWRGFIDARGEFSLIKDASRLVVPRCVSLQTWQPAAAAAAMARLG